MPRLFRPFVFGLCLAGAWVIPSDARRIEIRILHTTDLHGRILPTRDYDGNEDVGGLLRCATLIKKLRAERDHVLLVDCGDLYQGSAESLLSEGRIMIRALDALDYDAWILGNHEFDWGWQSLKARQDECAVPILAANVVAARGRDHALPRVKPYLLREFEGVRVAIVGLITPGVPSWSLPDLLGDLEFQNSVDTLRALMPALRAEAPDIMILATHQGFKPHGDDHANEINAIAQNFPEFDAIIGGHSHRVVESEVVGDSVFTQAGYYAAWLGCLDLAFDTVTRKLVEKSARVLPVGDTYARDAELEKLFSSELAAAQSYLDEKIGEAAEPLPAALDAQGRSPVQMLICRSVAQASGADMVLHGILADESLPAGDVRMKDVWRMVPYENRIGVMLLTPQELEEVLVENQGLRGSIQFMGAYGLNYDSDQDAAGQVRITNLRLPDGEYLHPRKRYRVAVNSYALASGGGRLKQLREIAERPESRLEVTGTDTRAAVIRYIRRAPSLTADALLHGPEK